MNQRLFADVDRQRYLPYRLNRVLLGVLAAVRPSLRKLNGEARTLLPTFLPSFVPLD